MGSQSAAKAAEYGLALDFPGAPGTPHQVAGFDGEFESGEVRPLEQIQATGELYEIPGSEDEEPREGYRAEGLPPRQLELAEAKRLHEIDGIPLVLMKREGSDGKWKRQPRRKAAGDQAASESQEG